MIEDFIEANGLKAKILPRSSSNLAKCSLFLAGSEPVLVVFPAGKKISLEAVKKELDCESIALLSEKKAFEITGYESNFVPPVSVYGVKVLIDKSLFSMGNLRCRVSETLFLEITAQEILKSNEEAIVGEYSD